LASIALKCGKEPFVDILGQLDAAEQQMGVKLRSDMRIMDQILNAHSQII
jgi:hypothetical protein